MADVFLAARHGPVGFAKLVVVKCLRSDLDDPSERLRHRGFLLEEARIAARLQHPNIVQTFEVAEDDEGEPFLAMEYLDGQPLSRLLGALARDGRALPTQLALFVVSEVLAGLHYAHELRDYDGRALSVVHRDVSPQNVFLTYDGGVKLVDFGIAKTALGSETEVGVVKGKASYMAPEHARGAIVDRRADVFATGVVLWEALAGQRLFRADTQVGTLQKLLFEPIPALDDVRPDLEPALARLCQRALARDRQLRFATAREMREAVLELVDTAAGDQRVELAALLHATFEDERSRTAQQIQLAMAERDESPPAPSARVAISHDGATSSDATTGERSPTLAVRAGRRGRRWPWLLAPIVSTLGTLAWLSAWPRHVPPAPAPPIAPAPTASTRVEELRLCGSNTVGAELAPALVTGLLRKKGAVAVTRQGGVEGHGVTIQAALGGRPVSVAIEASGTGTAFQGLARGSCDVGMASRPVSDAEAELVARAGLGDLRSPGSEHVVALDGIAVIVHPNNPVKALDRATLRALFTGSASDWSGVGGARGSVNVYARDDQSGTYDTFKHLVLGSEKLAPGARRYADGEALSDAVASDPGAIGFVGLAYVRGARAVAVSDADARALLPSAFTVATEAYLLSRRLFLYTTSKPRSPLAQELVSYALSSDGQVDARAASFVELTIGTSPAEPCDQRCPPRYAAHTRGAQRLSLDFRFRPGSNALDSRATRDLDRVVQFLRSYPSAQLMLLGFSDSTGDPQQNARLSLARARAVEAELGTRGVRAGVVDGFGAAMPVASVATGEGRERSRRVEVWMR